MYEGFMHAAIFKIILVTIRYFFEILSKNFHEVQPSF